MEEFKEAMDETIALVEEDTKNAQSIARSGPTSQGAEKTMSRLLLFPCQYASCSCAGRLFTFNELMPTEDNGVKRDHCIAAYCRFTGQNITKKNFELVA